MILIIRAGLASSSFRYQEASSAQVSSLQRQLESNREDYSQLEGELSSIRAAEAEARAVLAENEAECDRLRRLLEGQHVSQSVGGVDDSFGSPTRHMLAARAEAAEAALGQLKDKLSRLESSPAQSPAPKSERHPETGELNRRLRAAEAARVEAQIETESLRAKLADAAREVNAAQLRLAEVERVAHDAAEVAARREFASSSAFASQTSELSARLAEADRSFKAESSARARVSLPCLYSISH
jgi:chromosome segregation ATPase